MCYLGKPIREKTATGYKVAYKTDDGRYLSPATGIEYKPGRVQAAKKQVMPCYYFSDTILDKRDCCYVRGYSGRTAAFVREADAFILMGRIRDANNRCEESMRRVVVIKIAFAAEKHAPICDGDYTGKEVYIGKVITSVEQV